jgi:Bacterial Ig-like domain (group 2)
MRPLTRVMSIALLGLAACLDGTTEPKPVGGNGLTLTILPGPGGVTALDSGHVVVQGPTSKTVKVTPGTTVTIDQLLPGTYTVSLQGFQSGGVAYFGRMSGVTVIAGQNASATVTFASFRSAILELPAYTTDGQFVLVYSKVTNAASYVVQRAADATFTSPTETVVAATDTSVALSIPLTGPFHMRVIAVDPLGARGVASVAQVTTTLTSVTVTPPTASIAAGATQQFTAVAKDAANNTITGITFFWVSSNQSVALVDQTGLATGMNGGTVRISALGLGVPGGSDLMVAAQVATQLAFLVQPSDATAGLAISPAIQVEVQDAAGARVTTARDQVVLAIASGGGVLSGSTAVNAVNGVATFSGLSIDFAGTGYTLRARSGSLTSATSAAFTVAARGVMYIINDNTDVLQRLDPNTLAITDVGALGVGYAFGDCAWDPANSTLYMVEGRTANTLYRVNLQTGAATAIGVHGITDMFALGYHPPTDAVYGMSSSTNSLYRLNLATGAATLIGANGVGLLEGLVWDPIANEFVALHAGTDALYTIDVTTGAATLLRGAAGGINDAGFTYDPVIDRFWSVDFSGNIFRYDPSMGYARTTGATGVGPHTCIAYVR